MEQVNHFQFSINNIEYPICSFSFSQSLESPCGTFEIKVPDIKKWYDLVGSEVVLKFGAWSRHCVFDAIDITYPTDVTLSGRDLTSLLIDSSAQVSSFPGEQTFISIAKKLCEPFAIPIHDNGLGDFKIKNFTVSEGDSVFEILAKEARDGGIFLMTRDGKSLEIYSQKRAVFSINNNSAITELSIKKNIVDVFGTYITNKKIKVKKSEDMWGDHDTKAKTTKYTHIDTTANTKKIKIIHFSKTSDPQKALRLEAEKRRRKSKTISFSMPGMQEGFSLGDTININLEIFKDSAIITNIEYTISADGEDKTQITLGDL